MMGGERDTATASATGVGATDIATNIAVLTAMIIAMVIAMAIAVTPGILTVDGLATDAILVAATGTTAATVGLPAATLLCFHRVRAPALTRGPAGRDLHPHRLSDPNRLQRRRGRRLKFLAATLSTWMARVHAVTVL